MVVVSFTPPVRKNVVFKILPVLVLRRNLSLCTQMLQMTRVTILTRNVSCFKHYWTISNLLGHDCLQCLEFVIAQRLSSMIENCLVQLDAFLPFKKRGKDQIVHYSKQQKRTVPGLSTSMTISGQT